LIKIHWPNVPNSAITDSLPVRCFTPCHVYIPPKIRITDYITVIIIIAIVIIRCTSAANVVYRDVDIFGAINILLNYILGR
jgi:hypothetical protein